MPLYYVNKNAQANGDHEVHTSTCCHLPSDSNRVYLGSFVNCSVAVREAKQVYSQSDGCYYCCIECHKT